MKLKEEVGATHRPPKSRGFSDNQIACLREAALGTENERRHLARKWSHKTIRSLQRMGLLDYQDATLTALGFTLAKAMHWL